MRNGTRHCDGIFLHCTGRRKNSRKRNFHFRGLPHWITWHAGRPQHARFSVQLWINFGILNWQVSKLWIEHDSLYRIYTSDNLKLFFQKTPHSNWRAQDIRTCGVPVTNLQVLLQTTCLSMGTYEGRNQISTEVSHCNVHPKFFGKLDVDNLVNPLKYNMKKKYSKHFFFFRRFNVKRKYYQQMLDIHWTDLMLDLWNRRRYNWNLIFIVNSLNTKLFRLKHYHA